MAECKEATPQENPLTTKGKKNNKPSPEVLIFLEKKREFQKIENYQL